MKIAILSIGDEILSGDILNTNTQFLSESLWQEGFQVELHLGVRDEEAAIRTALLQLAGQVDFVLATGGLGPTMDDFTIEIVARTFDVGLLEDTKTVELLTQWFEKRGRELSANNRKQALIPEGGRALHNRHGTAPGVYVSHRNTHFYFMPGVPLEMQTIFKESILPDMLEKRAAQGLNIHYLHHTLRTFGAAESELDNRLKDLFDSRLAIGNVRIGFRVSFPDVFIKLSSWDGDRDQAATNLQEVLDKVRSRISRYIYSEDDRNLETVVGQLLMTKGTRCALAESCTGGGVAQRLTSVPGISQIFAGGIVAYSNELKIRLLSVSPQTLTTHGAVSEACAREMVLGIQKITGADLCASITGIAGPDGGSQDKPVGTVFIGITHRDDVRIVHHVLPFPREMFSRLVSSIVLREFWLVQKA